MASLMRGGVAAWIASFLMAAPTVVAWPPSQAHAQVLARMAFDENCNDAVALIGGAASGVTRYPCSLRPDLTQASRPNVVTYFLPYEVPEGEFRFLEPGGEVGDVVRFTDTCGDLVFGLNLNPNCFNQLADRMLVYSELPGTDLADTVLPDNVLGTIPTFEDALGNLNFVNGVIQFTGYSDTGLPPNCLAGVASACFGVPEPRVWALLLGGFFGLGIQLRRQRRGIGVAPA